MKKCQRRPIPDATDGSVFHFYETKYVPLHLIGRTTEYIDANRAVFRRLYQHFGRHIMLTEQTDSLVAKHFDWLLQQGLRPSTINTGCRAVWFAVWRSAYSLNLVDRLPTLRALPTSQEPPDAWSVEQLQQFLEQCDAASDKPIGGIHAGDLWGALIRVLWYTGLRRRSVLSIRRVDVDIDTGWIRVPGSNIKNRKGGQWRLGLDALEAIGRIWLPKRELLFPFDIDKTTFYKQFHRIREAAGLPKSKSHAGCLHLIRRSTATEAARSHGIGAAQTILGHSSPGVTRRYLDESKLPGHDSTKVLRPLGKSKPK